MAPNDPKNGGSGGEVVSSLLLLPRSLGIRHDQISYQQCDGEGEPLPGTKLKEVWRLADAPKDDKYQYTHFAHKINSFDTAPTNLLPSRLRPDRYALEMGDMSRSGFEKRSMEERQRAEKRTREEKGQSFNPKCFDVTEEVIPTPWGDLEVTNSTENTQNIA